VSLLIAATPWEATHAPVGIDTLEMVSTAPVGLKFRNFCYEIRFDHGMAYFSKYNVCQKTTLTLHTTTSSHIN